jgi:hypothetical protein
LSGFDFEGFVDHFSADGCGDGEVRLEEHGAQAPQ